MKCKDANMEPTGIFRITRKIIKGEEYNEFDKR